MQFALPKISSVLCPTFFGLVSLYLIYFSLGSGIASSYLVAVHFPNTVLTNPQLETQSPPTDGGFLNLNGYGRKSLEAGYLPHFFLFRAENLATFDINLPNASVKNYHILSFGVFWDPRAIFSQANDTRRIGISLTAASWRFL